MVLTFCRGRFLLSAQSRAIILTSSPKQMDFQNAPIVVRPDDDGGFTLLFDGPIHTDVSWLQRELDKVVAQKPVHVRLDLTHTEYISSTGLGLLVGFNTKIKATGGVVHVIAVQKRTLTLLKIAFLHKLFDISPDAVAVAEAGGSAGK